MAKKKKELDHNQPDRKFMIMLYANSQSYVFDEVMTKIQEYAPEWAYVLHDRDVDENDNLKREHYHVAVRFPTARTRKAVANVIGIEPNYIERWDSFKKACRYLMHADNPEKTPYGYYYVESNFDFVKLTNVQESEAVKVKEILNFIWTDECKNMVNIADFAIENGMWSEYRRSYAVIKDYFAEVQKQKKEKRT